MNNTYELNCLTRIRSHAETADVVGKISKWIEEHRGILIELDKKESEESTAQKGKFWAEKRRLSYPIKRNYFGYYISSWFSLEPEEMAKLQNFLKLENEILRFEIIKRGDSLEKAILKEMVPFDQIGKLEEKKSVTPFESRKKWEGSQGAIKKEKIATKEKSGEAEKPVEPIRPKEEIKEDVLGRKVTAEKVKRKEEIKKGEKIEKIEEIEETEKIEKEKREKKEITKIDRIEKKELEEKKAEKQEEKREKKTSKPKKISLEDLDKRLDDILKEEII